MLLDSPNSNPRQIPTRANMIAAMQWLVRDAQPNDSLFFHYSGHGGVRIMSNLESARLIALIANQRPRRR